MQNFSLEVHTFEKCLALTEVIDQMRLCDEPGKVKLLVLNAIKVKVIKSQIIRAFPNSYLIKSTNPTLYF